MKSVLYFASSNGCAEAGVWQSWAHAACMWCLVSDRGECPCLCLFAHGGQACYRASLVLDWQTYVGVLQSRLLLLACCFAANAHALQLQWLLMETTPSDIACFSVAKALQDTKVPFLYVFHP